jgi:predicted CoA-substrate-specific enzyme activase
MIDSDRNIVENHYTYCRGRPFHALREVLAELLSRLRSREIRGAAVTGTGGELAAGLIGGRFVNEIVAQSSSVAALYPRARTVIEMGGEDSKLIIMGPRGLEDFAMNTVCAAGTGSFLDQQARRIGVSIEKEFGELALRSRHPPHIAGRCSVFAKSDMIHLQQIATPVEDIVAGLCFAVARNVRSNLARGRELEKPVVFQGGVAANAGVVRAFREVLGLSDGELIIPEYHASMGAIGAVLHLLNDPSAGAAAFAGLGALEEYLARPASDLPLWEPLEKPCASGHKQVVFRLRPGARLEVYLGIDVGSLSTNVVLIDGDTNVVARRYLPTASKPLEAIRRGLAEIEAEVGDGVSVRGVGTTGSGRYLTGHFVGADTIKNEITAQATAAIFYHPEVDTVFEIGGQDSKFISIDHGVIVDFEMNKVCGRHRLLPGGAGREAASTSSGSSGAGPRVPAAREARRPLHRVHGERPELAPAEGCRQRGPGRRAGPFHRAQLSAKGRRSQAHRGAGPVPGRGDQQPGRGGRLREGDGQKDHRAAPLRRDGGHRSGHAGPQADPGKRRPDRFQGLPGQPDAICPQRLHLPALRKPLRCAPGEGGRREPAAVLRGPLRPLPARRGAAGEGAPPPRDPNLARLREKLLLGDWRAPVADAAGTGPTIGIPRGLMVYWQRFPYWRAFFEQLGFRVVLSRPSDRPLVTRSLGMLVAETCFPVEVMHGHFQDLLERDPDYIFMPFIVDNEAEAGNPTLNYNCPWIQTYPFMIRGAGRAKNRRRRS